MTRALETDTILRAQVRTQLGQAASASRNDRCAGGVSYAISGSPAFPKTLDPAGSKARFSPPGVEFPPGAKVPNLASLVGEASPDNQKGWAPCLPLQVCASIILKYYVHEVLEMLCREEASLSSGFAGRWRDHSRQRLILAKQRPPPTPCDLGRVLPCGCLLLLCDE